MSAADWFDRRTFAAGDVALDELTQRKSTLGLSVSVVLPARNEAATIAGVIDSITPMAGGLVDEIVVMDGGSTDGTAAIAADRGARVHDDLGVLAEHGPALGKGDALWRALSVTSGDLVVYVDTDIRNPDHRFVSGILTPLLIDPEVSFVKAFYDRPIEVGGQLQPSGGGRVTELMARPLLNAFWPELSGLVQPLSGEYGGRRDLLESIPFFTGYGVELGLLVDILGVAGADAIAQVDLATRIHRNQTLPDLSRMAYGILSVAVQRLGDAGLATFANALAGDYTQFERDDEGHPVPSVTALGDTERPPLRSLSR